MVAIAQPLPKRQAHPIAQMLRRAADAWAPVEHPPLADWCTQNLRMPAGFFAEPGPFDLRTRPYWREPLECVEDPDIQRLTLMADAQRGKTVLLMAILLALCVIDPSPAMLAGPDQDAMRELRDKVYAMAMASAAVAGKIPPQRLWNDRYIDLESMYVYLAYSGSLQRLRGRTCKRVFCTEVDVWQDSPRLGKSAELIRARVKAFPEHLIVMESTPTDEASIIDSEYKRSDQRKFHVPCPVCNWFQELRFFMHTAGKFAGRGGIGGLVDSRGAPLSAEDARAEAHYVCEQGCKIRSERKAAMLPDGLWVPRGQHVDAQGRLRGPRYRKSNRHAGFHLSALYDDGKTFGDVAAEFIGAKETNSLRVFFNNWLGLKYTTGTNMPKWKTLGRRYAGTHRRGRVPAECWFLTAAADVQANCVRWAVRGWGDRATSWLIDWGIITREAGKMDDDGLIAEDLAQLETKVLDVVYPVDGINPRGLREISVRVLGVDAGHRITDVHNFVRAQPGGRVRAIRGDQKVDPSMGYRMGVVERNARTGKIYEGGLQLWGIYVNVYRHDLIDRFQFDPQAPGAFLFPAGILNESDGADYLRQLVNQGPETVLKPSGRQVVEFRTRDRSLGEHFWDIEVYNRCLADMVTGAQWDAEKWQVTKSQLAATKPPHPNQEGRAVAARDFNDDFSAR